MAPKPQFEYNRFPCTLCKAHFGTPKESAAHRVSDHGKPEDEAYLCHACPRTFHSQAAAHLHAGLHLHLAPEVKFPCTFKKCKGMYRTAFARRMHVKYDHEECTIDAQGRRQCGAAKGCNFTQAADYGLALHAIHEHGAATSKKRFREESVDNDATPFKRTRRTPAVPQPGSTIVPLAPAPAPAPKFADVPTAGPSTEPTWGWTDSEFESLLQENELDQAFAGFWGSEGAQFTSASLPETALCAPTARQAEVIDLTADEPSPPLAAPTVPSAPQPAPPSLEEQRRNSAEAEARQEEFLARQMAGLRAEQERTGIAQGPENMRDTIKLRKHAASMQKWRANRETMRGYVPTVEAGKHLEREKAKEMERNTAKEAKKQASKEARKEKKKLLREEEKAEKAAMEEAKKAMKAAMKAIEGKNAASTARQEEASPQQKVETSPAVEARPSTASTEQDATAPEKFGEISEEDHLASLFSSSPSRVQVPITSPEDDGSPMLALEHEESQYMRSKRLEKQAAEEQAGEGKVEEDLEALLTNALAQEDGQAVDGDDQGSLFGESLEELFGEGEDDAPARPVTPASSAPQPARKLSCLPMKQRKD